MSVHVEVNRDVCIGAGNCVLTLPAVFDQDDEGIVTLLETDPDDDDAGLVGRAVRLCPSGAVSIRA